jgi:hypothetical protein
MTYNGWGMPPAQDFMYPVEYHNRYGYMYPSLEPCIHYGMVQPIMYPDIYYRIYPYVHRTCDRMDNPYMSYPSEAQVESMVDDCYDACVKGMPDLIQYADLKTEEAKEVDASQFRRRPLLRDLIAIILISELFRRRRRIYNGYAVNYGIGAGYGTGVNDSHNPEYGYGAGYCYGAGYGTGASYGYGANSSIGYGSIYGEGSSLG